NIGAFYRRLKRFLSDEVVKGIVCQRFLPAGQAGLSGIEQKPVDFYEAVVNNKIILINLPILLDEYRDSAPIIGTFIVSLLYGAIFRFGELKPQDRPSYMAVIDEFQNFLFAVEDF